MALNQLYYNLSVFVTLWLNYYKIRKYLPIRMSKNVCVLFNIQGIKASLRKISVKRVYPFDILLA